MGVKKKKKSANLEESINRPRRARGLLTLRSFLAVCSCSSTFSSVLSDRDDEAASLDGAAAIGAGREPPPAPPSALPTFCRPLWVRDGLGLGWGPRGLDQTMHGRW